MSKQLMEMKKKKENNDDLSTSNFEANNITSNSFHVPSDDSTDLEEYKKMIDESLAKKKEKLESAYAFKKTSAEEKIKEQYDEKLREDLETERERLNKVFEEKKIKLENSYKEKTETAKQKIKNEHMAQLNKEKDTKTIEFNNKKDALNKEILQLQKEYEKLQFEANVKDDNEEYDNQLKQIEKEYNEDLSKYQNELQSKQTLKEKELDAYYTKKKNEFESSLQLSMSHQVQQQQQATQDTALQNKKNLLTKAHEAKLEHYKNSLINEYYRSTEKEKNEILNNFQKEVSGVKDNFDQMKSFYDQQKEIFKTEQSVVTANAFLDKMKSIIDNKTTVFKSLLEQNYFMLKKKIKECENIKELASFGNKEIILSKISELLTMLFYSNIYETLYNDLNAERDMLSNHLEDLIRQCEGIISTFNSDKKIQLGMYLCNPNFN